MNMSVPPTTRPRWSLLACVSLLLGLLSMVYFALTGVFAVWIGYHGLYAVNASEGRLRGRWLAIAGMVLGFAGTCYSIVWFLGVGVATLQQKSNRARCQDNLRRIGEAVLIYHDTHEKAFPRAIVPAKGLEPEDSFSWLTALLPYLDATSPKATNWQSTYDSFQLERGWQAEVNREGVNKRLLPFLCPEHPLVRTDRNTNITCYVGFSGVGEDSARLAREDPRAGFFGYERIVRSSEIEHGLQYVLICAETARSNGPWAAGGEPTVRGLVPSRDAYFGPGRDFGGLHKGGTNTLWADGSVQFLADDHRPELVRTAVKINRVNEPGPEAIPQKGE